MASPRAIGILIALGGVVVAFLVAVGVTAQRRAQVDAKADELNYRAQLTARAKRLEALLPRMRATRFAGLDGQCLGRGYPGFGFILEGGTYDENEAIGLAAACRPFSGGQHKNITNFFCCSDENPLDTPDAGP